MITSDTASLRSDLRMVKDYGAVQVGKARFYWLAYYPSRYSHLGYDEARADGWLIAYARALGCTVVTLEIANPNVQRKVPIPNVCDAFGVDYTNTFDMLRALATQFEWQRE